MSAKYDLLASKISDFDAVQLSEKRKKTCSWQKYAAIGFVIALLSVVILTLIIVLAVEIAKHRSSAGGAPPSNSSSSCRSDPPAVLVPCSANDDEYNNEDDCTGAGCCWYSNQCVLDDYHVTCSSKTDELFTCLPEEDNWNDTYAKEVCSRRGCCWTDQSLNPFVKCHYPAEYGYSVINETVKETANGKIMSIVRKNPQPPMYMNGIQQLTVEITYETNTMLRVKVNL